MRVVVFGVYLAEGMAGTRRVRNLFDPLIKAGTIETLNIQYYKQSSSSFVRPEVKEQDGICYKYVRIPGKNPFAILKIAIFSFLYLKKWKSKNKSDKNIFYCYGYPDIISYPVILFARILKYRIVFDIVENNWAFNQKTNWIHKLRVRSTLLLSGKIRKFAHGCIGISIALVDLLENKIKVKCPTQLIPISVDIETFKPSEKINLDEKVNVFWGGAIAFSESLDSNKDGIKELINAFDKTCKSNTLLNLTGYGDDRSITILKQHISKMKNSSNIVFHGYLSFEVYCKLLSASDIAVMNRVDTKFANFGFPFKLGEYLASGKAVIATDVGDVGVYLKNMENSILIKPSDNCELEVALQRLFEDRNLVIKLGKSARNVAEKYFSTETHSKLLFDLLQKC